MSSFLLCFMAVISVYRRAFGYLAASHAQLGFYICHMHLDQKESMESNKTIVYAVTSHIPVGYTALESSTIVSLR